MAKTQSSPGASILEYLRRAATPFFLNLMFGMTMFAVAAIDTYELKIILTYALVILTFFTDFMLIRSMGELAYKMKIAGDRKREGLPAGMTDGGADGYKPAKEYRPYKGFVIGAVASLIPVIFVIVDVTAHSTGARLAYSMIAGWAFWPVFNTSTSAHILFTLIPCAVMVVVSGIAYILGSNKEKLRQFALKQREEEVAKAKSKGAKKR